MSHGLILTSERKHLIYPLGSTIVIQENANPQFLSHLIKLTLRAGSASVVERGRMPSGVFSIDKDAFQKKKLTLQSHELLFLNKRRTLPSCIPISTPCTRNRNCASSSSPCSLAHSRWLLASSVRRSSRASYKVAVFVVESPTIATAWCKAFDTVSTKLGEFKSKSFSASSVRSREMLSARISIDSSGGS